MTNQYFVRYKRAYDSAISEISVDCKLGSDARETEFNITMEIIRVRKAEGHEKYKVYSTEGIYKLN